MELRKPISRGLTRMSLKREEGPTASIMLVVPWSKGVTEGQGHSE